MAQVIETPTGTTEAGRTGLLDISEVVIRAFNDDDARSIVGLLSPSLAARYDEAAVAKMVTYCKASVIDRFVRTSLPVSGGSHYGFFAVYGKQKSTTMILEIDREQRIVFWTLSDDAVEGDFACALKAFD